MRNALRICVGIVVLSFIGMFGNCVSCSQTAPSTSERIHSDGTVTKDYGFSSAEDKEHTGNMIKLVGLFFGVSVIAGFIALLLWRNLSVEEEQLKGKK